MTNVFISYSHDNAEFVDRLKLSLADEGYIIVGQNLNTGAPFAETIYSSIRSCDLFIVIFDKLSINTAFEAGMAIGAGKRILVISTPNAQLPIHLSAISQARVDLSDQGSTYQILNALNSLPPAKQKPSENIKEITVADLVNDRALLDVIDYHEFERAIGNWFSANGYSVQHCGRPGQLQEIDIIASNNFNGRSIGIEVKKYRTSSIIPVNTVREIYERARDLPVDKIIIVSSSNFTKSAQAFAKEMGARIELLTIDELIAPGHLPL